MENAINLVNHNFHRMPVGFEKDAMRHWIKQLALGIGLTVGTQFAIGVEKSSRDEALALIAKAQEYIRVHGLDASYAEFNRLDSPFNTRSPINTKGDLYLYTLDFHGYQVVHGKNPKIRGKVMIAMQDQNGTYLIREMAAKCKSPGKGWVDYIWPHPITNALEPKAGYIERIPGTETCIGTGIYK